MDRGCPSMFLSLFSFSSCEMFGKEVTLSSDGCAVGFLTSSLCEMNSDPRTNFFFSFSSRNSRHCVGVVALGYRTAVLRSAR